MFGLSAPAVSLRPAAFPPCSDAAAVILLLLLLLLGRRPACIMISLPVTLRRAWLPVVIFASPGQFSALVLIYSYALSSMLLADLSASCDKKVAKSTVGWASLDFITHRAHLCLLNFLVFLFFLFFCLVCLGGGVLPAAAWGTLPPALVLP
mmetsp:Transcript_20155/g.43079  ORF Transcript_20155/g.43079 Transcript_20155/m.43079 type:complete len:151 (-) Transcript_20155:103-555(-)